MPAGQLLSSWGTTGLTEGVSLRDKLVEVEQQIGDRRIAGQFDGLEPGQGGFADAKQFGGGSSSAKNLRRRLPANRSRLPVRQRSAIEP